MNLRLGAHKALVSGLAAGIGYAVAPCLASEGAHLAAYLPEVNILVSSVGMAEPKTSADPMDTN